MEQEKYLQDLSDIRQMMHRSSQFLSLSGLSGILAGIYALAGAFGVKYFLQADQYAASRDELFASVVMVAAIVLVLSVTTAAVLTYRKAQRLGETTWNSTSKRLLFNFMVPLVTGGIFALLMLVQGRFELIAPAMLIFYGFACLNAGKYTFRDVRSLGLTMTALGLFATAFPGYGLELWAVGFGLCHIFYGAVMYLKYERNA